MTAPTMTTEQDQEITATVLKERSRLWNFIRRRVADQTDADDILQDVFYEFTQAYRLPEPIEQVSAWLFRVARNRIIDRFRKKKEVALEDIAHEDDEDCRLDLMLPSPDAGPEAAYTRAMLLEELQRALEDLPANQREVFIAHELDGISFKEMAADTGISINTLLARKRYAVLYLRQRLQALYEE
ncbi:sigma-70 family RNA polymerase sigma factor [Duganella sp. FT80W]|uniref:Sigma-70 family RNA polymerase sigma factor n=1 Tax=Duganella guangzhouensis TaxID=2666084 RepID=A0A6I2L3U5_9BURK|nr:sigma-70 family RNA polymerase sigma factor [Duganella guangzhouensis]MRW92798.1 sigma-70 family RNA polymerase sigma factor [Duganella guangzhouensis]